MLTRISLLTLFYHSLLFLKTSLLVNLLLYLTCKNHLVHAWPCTQNRDVKRFTLCPTSIAQHKRKLKSSLSFTTSDIVCRGTQPREYSGGSRGGARTIIFRPEWGSKGRKCYFRPPPISRSGLPAPPPPPPLAPILGSGSATAVTSKNDRMWQFESIKSSRIL